jgi:hypothetical protein
MQYRSGVDVAGPEEMAKAAGGKVQLTGQWVAVPDLKDKKGEEYRRFDATSFEVMAEKCSPPAETTPISKRKQKEEKAAAKANEGNNPK